MSKKVKLGIIGIGGMGSGHVKRFMTNQCPEIELVAVADINPDRLVWAQETYPDAFAKFNTAENEKCAQSGYYKHVYPLLKNAEADTVFVLERG